MGSARSARRSRSLFGGWGSGRRLPVAPGPGNGVNTGYLLVPLGRTLVLPLEGFCLFVSVGRSGGRGVTCKCSPGGLPLLPEGAAETGALDGACPRY